MEGINDRIAVRFEVLTPLAIGAGAEKDWVNGMDFIVDGGSLHRLNLQKMVSSGIDLTKLSACFEQKSFKGVKDLIGNKLESVTDFIKPLPSGISSDAGLTNPVKAFMKNQLTGKPIVPGSSIKGAIRSIILERLTKGDRSGIKSNLRSIFGSPEDGTDFMRFLKFSDIEFKETQLVNTKIFNLRRDDSCHSWQGGWKHGRSNTDDRFRQTGFNTVYETIVPEQFGIGSLMLSGKMFGKISSERSESYGKSGWQTGISGTEIKKSLLQKSGEAPVALFRAINEHTETYLKREKAFFEKYETDRSRDILDSIDRLLSEVKTALEIKTSCIFKMSAGSGFHSITGDWQFSDYASGELNRKRNKEAKPKSRKIAVYGDELSLMGFVKMSVASESEIERHKEDMEKKHCALEQAGAEAMAIEDTQKRAREARRQREQKYNSAIDVADKNYTAYNPACDDKTKTLTDAEKALELYIKAEEIWPEGQRHKEKIEDLKTAIQILKKHIEYERTIKEQEQRDKESKLKFIEAGLSSLDKKAANDPAKYMITSFKQVKNAVDSWLKKSCNTTIPEDQDKYLRNTLDRIYNNLGTKRDEVEEKRKLSDFTSPLWKTVIQWCGSDRAESIFDSVTKS